MTEENTLAECDAMDTVFYEHPGTHEREMHELGDAIIMSHQKQLSSFIPNKELKDIGTPTYISKAAGKENSLYHTAQAER